jgi:hypothetical protein
MQGAKERRFWSGSGILPEHIVPKEINSLNLSRYVTCLSASAICAGISHAGPAVNQFEVKNLEVEVGQWEFQSQNAYSWNQPDRKTFESVPGEFVFDENTVVRQRYALELELGISPRIRSRFGIEFEQERVDDPTAATRRNNFDALELEELAVEVVWVLLPPGENTVGLGLLSEYQYTLESTEADSFVFGPIIEFSNERWSLVLNPAVVQFFGGDDTDDKLDFTYAAQLANTVSERWVLAIEAYGTTERIGGAGRPGEEAIIFGDHDLHRLGPIAYYQHAIGDGEDGAELSLGVGIFVGLNDNTPDGTFKLSIEYEF